MDPDQPGKTTSWAGSVLGVYYLVRLYLPDSPLGERGRQPGTFGVLPGPLASDLVGSVWPL